MAPLFQYLHICLILSALSVSFSESETQTQLPQIIPTNQILLGRRILLAKAVDADEEDNLVMVLPKKKKVQKTNLVDEDGDDELPIKKKKKKLTSLDDELEKEIIPKKKKSFSYDEKDSISLSKKKKSSSNDEEESISLSKKKIDTKVIIKPKTTSLKNQTKLVKPTSNSSNSSTKNQTKLIKPIISSTSSKNKTKLTKPTSSTSKDVNDPKPNLNKTKINKSNSSTTSKALDSLKNIPNNSAKNIKPIQKRKTPPSPSTTLLYQDEDDDLIADFRDLPAKFHQTFVPDLQRISTTSRVYLSKASKEITKGFKPYVGTKYAASMTTAISLAFVVVPLLLVSLIFNQIKAYVSLQRLLIFIQIYLAIYFSILCISSLVTGLEPLRFFYATSRSTYVWLQLLQTLGYALFLLLLLMYLVLVFSTESGLAHKLLGLAQTLVGFAVGLHYYMTVFHRVVLRQPPKTNWKVHGIYAACFLLICLFARADRRKKAYPEEGGQQGKNN